MITKGMLIASALIAAALVTAVEVPARQSDRLSAVERLAPPVDVVPLAKLPVPPASLRKPELINEPAPATAPKAEKPATTASLCREQHWPYLSAECITNGKLSSSRVIPIDRKMQVAQAK